MTHYLSLDGVLDFLNSKNMTEAGPLDLIDYDDSGAVEGVQKQSQKRLGHDLPGSMPNRGRPIIRTKCLRIAQTGRSWAAANTEGVLLYSMDDSFISDPTDLDIDVTPEELCKSHALKSLQKAVSRLHQDLADTCSSNEYMLRYLCSTSNTT